jgi:hypothetical protein
MEKGREGFIHTKSTHTTSVDVDDDDADHTNSVAFSPQANYTDCKRLVNFSANFCG